MKTTKLIQLCILALLFMTSNSNAQITDLQDWLALTPSNRPTLESLSFSKQVLTKDKAKTAINLLLADKQAQMLSEYGSQWNNRLLEYNGYEMPFFYDIFGAAPSDGRSLYISLHGGGGTTTLPNVF